MAPEQVVLETDTVYVDNLALVGWYRLPAPVRAKVLETLGALAGQPPEKWPAGQFERWGPDENLYAYPVTGERGDRLVFFYPTEGRIHIESLLSRELMERVAAKKSLPGK